MPRTRVGPGNCGRTGLTDQSANKVWRGVRLNQPDWGDGSHAAPFAVELKGEGLLFHLILNGYRGPLEFELRRGPRWRRWVDTFLPSPDDITDWQAASAVPGSGYWAGPRSVVMMFAQKGG
jgi:glycogen operon protein